MYILQCGFIKLIIIIILLLLLLHTFETGMLNKHLVLSHFQFILQFSNTQRSTHNVQDI